MSGLGHPGGCVDADSLFDAVEDVIATAHPSAASAAGLPEAVTDAVAELAAALEAASGAGPHDGLVAASRHVLDMVTSRGNRLRDMVPAFTELHRVLADQLPPDAA